VLLVAFGKKIKKSAIFMFAKLIQMLFGSVFFMWIIGTTCTIIA
jgi:hypothetical protein